MIATHSWFHFENIIDRRQTVSFLVKQYMHVSNNLQWNPAKMKCHGTEKNVRYGGVFVIAKTPL